MILCKKGWGGLRRRSCFVQDISICLAHLMQLNWSHRGIVLGCRAEINVIFTLELLATVALKTNKQTKITVRWRIQQPSLWTCSSGWSKQYKRVYGRRAPSSGGCEASIIAFTLLVLPLNAAPPEREKKSLGLSWSPGTTGRCLVLPYV